MDPQRRKFLQTAGQTAASLAAFASAPAVISRALAVAPYRGNGSIEDVEHVVILMQENRSFDHYFGTLRGVRGFGDRHTVPLPDGRTIWEQSNGIRIVMPYRLDLRHGNALRSEGTPHSWADAQAAWDHGRMSAWPSHKRDASMAYHARTELPFHFALADAFTVCDAYHCAQHGGTNPNRLFLWTGSNGASAAGVAAVVNEWDELGASSEGYDWTAYPERLQAAGISWKVYQNLPDNFTDNPLAGFRRFRAASQQLGAAAGLPYEEGLDADNPLLKGIANTMPDGGLLGSFRDDVRQGRLPQVSWVIAPGLYSEHPGPSSPAQGGWYMQAVLDALVSNPEVWRRTALIINFDENDGYFDHVPPPAPPSRQTDGTVAGRSTCDVSAELHVHSPPPGATLQPPPGGQPYGMGPRVPMLVVSPWSRGGWVNSQVFDHTSVIRFLERRFGVVEPNISAWRRAVAGDLVSAFDFARADESAPVYFRVGKDDADSLRIRQEQRPQMRVPDEAGQRLPDQETGTRPSRALPYELNVVASCNAGKEQIALRFANSGGAGAVLHVYDRLHLDRLPRRYTIEAGRALDDTWDAGGDAGRYDLWLAGPNGFHRHCAGDLRAESSRFDATPEIAVRYDRAGCVLIVELSNPGLRPCMFRIADNPYRAEGPRSFLVPRESTIRSEWHLGQDHGWYDLSFDVIGLPQYLRRIAGRLETGQHGISDPLLGRAAGRTAATASGVLAIR